ncbi:MAG: DUF2076 domain-containing protein [Stellaceae bacterium]
MTPQERDLLTTLLARLKNAAGQQKDPDADALIRQTMAEQPDAPYYLAQTVLIQDLSLHNAQNTITELERQLTDAQQQARPASTSFLGSLFGSRQAPPSAPQQSTGSVPAAGPWTRAPQVAAAPPAQPYPQQQPYQQGGYGQQPGAGGFMGGGMGAGGMGGGGGFLRSAAATAAGVAGGALLFQGIESLFGQRASAGILGGQGTTPGLGESVVNNYYGDAGAGQGGADQDFSGGSFDPSGGGQNQDFSGGDAGGGQDYSSGQDYAGGSFDPGGGQDQDFGGGQDQDFSGGDFGGGDSNQC